SMRPVDCPDSTPTLRQERPSSCSQNFSCVAPRHAVSVVSVAAASSGHEGHHSLWDPCGHLLSPRPSFSVWFRLIHLQFFSPSGFGPPCLLHWSNDSLTPSGNRQSSRAVPALSTGAACGLLVKR